ncbi:MAG: hypothetical protein ACE5GA_00135 [Candidatus Zixiibacteriota bacterium]
MSDEGTIQVPTPRTIIGVSEKPAAAKKPVKLTTVQRRLIYQIFARPQESLAAIGRETGAGAVTGKTLKSIGCKLQPALDDYEITIDSIAFVIKEALSAERVVVSKNGEEHCFPDHGIRLRAADMLAKLGDMYPAKKLEVDDKRDHKNPFAKASMESLELIETIVAEMNENGDAPLQLEHAPED